MNHWTRAGGAAFVLAIAGALASGCGSSGATAPAAAPGDTALAGYVACLQHNGVPAVVPSGGPRNRPSGFPSGVRPSGFPSGVRPSGVRPSGGFGGPGGPGGADFLRPPGVDDGTWQRAQQACASVRPSFGPGQGGGTGDNGALRAYLNCLGQHGVVPSRGVAGLNTADPAVVAADKICGVLKPSGAPAATPTPSPTG